MKDAEQPAPLAFKLETVVLDGCWMTKVSQSPALRCRALHIYHPQEPEKLGALEIRRSRCRSWRS